VAKSSWIRLSLLAAGVCIANLAFSVAGTLAAPRVIATIPPLNLTIRFGMALILLASFLPGVALLAGSKECRASTLRFRAGAGVYIAAVLLGFTLPFSSYLGARNMYPLPWNARTVPILAEVFLINIFLTPLWEEIIWRGYFFNKISSMLRTKSAIVISSSGWTVWHAGFLYFLYHSGVKVTVLAIFLPQIFFIGIILCSLFTMGHRALTPCVFFHTAFDASIWTYTASGHPVNDIGAMIAETIFTLIVAIVMFNMAARPAENDAALIESLQTTGDSVKDGNA
jgi:membrane protease YdiL (CAAX protease family)